MQQIEIESEHNQTQREFHLAGIVPVSGPRLDFNMPWHDCMMPIAPNYLAVERAILECAWAGCNTIWLVCNNDMQPLLKSKIGNFVLDPVNSYFVHEMPFIHKRMTNYKRIPIFYTPIQQKHVGIRDSYPFSILQGAYTCYCVSLKMSQWIKPTMFYVAFPYGAYDPSAVRPHRAVLSTSKNCVLTYNNTTIKDGEYLSFTFSPNQYKEYRDLIKKRRKDISIDETSHPKTYTLANVFGSDILQSYQTIDISTYHNIGSWQGYCSFLSSGERDKYESEHIEKYFKQQRFYSIGYGEKKNVII